MPMKRIDFKGEFGKFYFPPPAKMALVDLPALNFAMIDGMGNPNTAPAFREALEALYGVSYTAKFTLKRAGVVDYRVAPLEALWGTHGGSGFSSESKDTWEWTAMVMQPVDVTPVRFREAAVKLKEKRDPPGLANLRLERFHEGLAAQVLYLGPYSAEGPIIEKLHSFIKDEGLTARGRHHEIYLGDPRRNAPERLRTVIRQPVKR